MPSQAKRTPSAEVIQRWCVIAAAAILLGWRLTWLAHGVDASTDAAESLRLQAWPIAVNHVRQSGDVLATPDLIELRMVGDTNVVDTARTIQIVEVRIWDDSAPVFVVPGIDGAPGHRGWDDDRNGIIDDATELGAAWSDDKCVTSADFDDNITEPYQTPHRVLSYGAFVTRSGKHESTTQRHRVEYRWSAQRDH